MFSRKELNLQEILLSASRGKFTIKLPKVLNKATGKKTNAPFLFSAARWSKATNSYLKSISSKPTGYVEATVKIARAILQDVAEIPGSLNDYEEDEDERAMISIVPLPPPYSRYMSPSSLLPACPPFSPYVRMAPNFLF
ncbi:hypothetical protein BDR03DRAFT_1012584 [Suillus americanus]|nr:hypothetical protein BDR03DRAFT_1012584 [Suillus americanus]